MASARRFVPRGVYFGSHSSSSTRRKRTLRLRRGEWGGRLQSCRAGAGRRAEEGTGCRAAELGAAAGHTTGHPGGFQVAPGGASRGHARTCGGVGVLSCRAGAGCQAAEGWWASDGAIRVAELQSWWASTWHPRGHPGRGCGGLQGAMLGLAASPHGRIVRQLERA